MICSTFWLPKTATLNDYLEDADKLNKSAEKIKKAGMQAGFHNHEFEFAVLDNQLIYDALMNRFDADLARSALEAASIDSMLRPDDAGGMRPALWVGRGVEVLVRAEDAERANEILEKPARSG